MCYHSDTLISMKPPYVKALLQKTSHINNFPKVTVSQLWLAHKTVQ